MKRHPKEGRNMRPLDAPASDYGPPEAKLRGDGVVEQPDPNDRSTRRLRVCSDVIAWYEKRNYLDNAQARALETFGRDGYLAGLECLEASAGRLGGYCDGNVSAMSDARVAAGVRRGHALDMLDRLPPKIVLRQIVDAVAIGGCFAGGYAMRRWGMSPSEALDVLRLGATRLAKHYGMSK